MEVSTNIVQHDGRPRGELRFELTPEEGRDFPDDGPFCLVLEADEVLLIPCHPDELEPFAVSSEVERGENGIVAIFRLNAAQMTRLKAKVPHWFPNYRAGSRLTPARPRIRIRPMYLDQEDGGHHVLLVTLEGSSEDQLDASPPIVVPVMEHGAWRDDQLVRYLDANIDLHETRPEPPYLVLRGKQIVDRPAFLHVWELQDEAAMRTYMKWAEDRDRREILESN